MQKIAAICFFLIVVQFTHTTIGQAQSTKQSNFRSVLISIPTSSTPRVQYGANQLKQILVSKGYQVFLDSQANFKKPNVYQNVPIQRVQLAQAYEGMAEGFIITGDAHQIDIKAGDASGALYGFLALKDSVSINGTLPTQIQIKDEPQMKMRGTCIGLQKPFYLPGRTVYEYPLTPETFPWLYDKQMWTQYLDSLVQNRMNSLYLWNGHPFASLVKLKEYPYAVEVSDETFKKNEEIYRFITEEADKRGIWVIQMFYNIIVSKPFAEYHHIKTQDRNRPIIPLIADYTRKSIAAFVQKYPNVGLMVCLGEAMEGTGNDDIEWFTKTIIPGMKDGLKALGRSDEPPIVLRAHDTDAPSVIKAAQKLYSNLYTEAKFNGEALTTYAPRGAWAELHQTLSHLGSVQIENVHILANLEPFRYGATDFIQKSVQGMKTIMGGNGIHLYPQASYWDFPYTADSIKGKRLLQIERDWIWYKAWNRYAWNSDRDSVTENNYWSKLLALHYGCSIQQGQAILQAYNASGQIAPKLLRRFGITDGNRQTLTLGMLMTQLVNPYRFGLFDLLYDAESPVGEKLIEYAQKDWNHSPHIGETPPQIIKEVVSHGAEAVQAIEKAAPYITKNKAEFDRLKNDMDCYNVLANHYALKTQAALYVLRYKYSSDIHDLEKALPYLKASVVEYKKLVDLTKGTYLYANSMQTQQRKIPIRGVDGTFKTWAEVYIPFIAELQRFEHCIDSLKAKSIASPVKLTSLTNAKIEMAYPTFEMGNGATPFLDSNYQSMRILQFAAPLQGLKGIQMSFAKQVQLGTQLHFTNQQPVQLLVGFFNKKDPSYLKAPELETDASANEYGQSEIKIANGLVLKGMPNINIHTYSFAAGTHDFTLAKGACILIGFIDSQNGMPVFDAGLSEQGIKKEIDWLFE
jgi:hypothetical protein